MFNYQVAILLVLLLLIIPKASRFGALVLLVEHVVYHLLVVDLSAVLFYSCTSFLNLAVGYILQSRYIFIAICSYSLVFVNVLGFWLWYMYLEPTIYDNICAIILIAQALLLAPKGLINGFTALGYNIQHSMVKPDGFDGSKKNVTMRKNKTNKET